MSDSNIIHINKKDFYNNWVDIVLFNYYIPHYVKVALARILYVCLSEENRKKCIYGNKLYYIPKRLYRQIIQYLGVSNNYFYVVLSILRKNKLLYKNNVINPLLIPASLLDIDNIGEERYEYKIIFLFKNE